MIRIRGDRKEARRSNALLMALMIGEFLLFDRIGAHWHTGIYPRWNDQIQYLTEAYTGYEYLLGHGFWAGMWQTLLHPAAQGTLDDCYAVLLFCLAGPSRSAALAVNMLAFLAWQGGFFFAIRRRSGSGSMAWASAGLLLCLAGPWSGSTGSATDFRLDHLAMCTMGVVTAAALMTEGFRRLGWSLAFGATVALALCTRFLTGPYFVLIFAALLAWAGSGPERRRRATHLGFAAIVALVLAGPLVWLNRLSVYNYYWIGHFFGPESAIRNPHLNLTQSIAFVWGHFGADHLGSAFEVLALLISLGLVAGALASTRRSRAAPSGPRAAWAGEAAMIGGIFLLAPALILSLHNLKSPVVEGIMTPGIVLLLLGCWEALLGIIQPRLSATAAKRLGAALGVLVLSGGAAYFVVRQLTPPHSPQFVADAHKVNSLADGIFLRSRAAGITAPRVAVDEVTDCLDGQVLRVICYERHRVWVPFVMTLPTGIGEESKSVLLDRLAQSDFVFITEGGPVGGWPYDREMRALEPTTAAWCEAHLYPVDRFTLFGQSMVLFQRRDLPLPARP